MCCKLSIDMMTVLWTKTTTDWITRHMSRCLTGVACSEWKPCSHSNILTLWPNSPGSPGRPTTPGGPWGMRCSVIKCSHSLTGAFTYCSELHQQVPVPQQQSTTEKTTWRKEEINQDSYNTSWGALSPWRPRSSSISLKHVQHTHVII